jgi:hypothetical protein
LTLRSVNRTFFPYKAFSHLLTGASLYFAFIRTLRI